MTLEYNRYMCAICSMTSVPVCNLAGGCSAQTLDFIKVALMTGGAGAGTFLTILRTDILPKRKENERKQKSR